MATVDEFSIVKVLSLYRGQDNQCNERQKNENPTQNSIPPDLFDSIFRSTYNVVHYSFESHRRWVHGSQSNNHFVDLIFGVEFRSFLEERYDRKS